MGRVRSLALAGASVGAASLAVTASPVGATWVLGGFPYWEGNANVSSASLPICSMEGLNYWAPLNSTYAVSQSWYMPPPPGSTLPNCNLAGRQGKIPQNYLVASVSLYRAGNFCQSLPQQWNGPGETYADATTDWCVNTGQGQRVIGYHWWWDDFFNSHLGVAHTTAAWFP